METTFFDETALALSANQIFALAPYLYLCLGIALSVVAAGLRASTDAVRWIVVATLLTFGWGMWSTLSVPAIDLFGASLVMDSAVRGVGVGLSLLGALAALFSKSTDRDGNPEWGALLLTNLLGLSVLVGCRDFVSFFVALETASISGAMLAALDTRRERSLEAGLKYLLMGAFASALFLMGGAWLYGSFGTFDFSVWAEEMPALLEGGRAPLVETLAFLFGFVALLIKLGAVPFHMWSPDVYQAAPTGLAAYLASASKLGFFCATAFFLASTGALKIDWLRDFLYFTAIGSMLVGSLLALVQQKVRRLLAYSGVANVGYGLLLLASATPEALGTLLSYFLVYGIAFVGAFGLVEHFCRSLGREAHSDLSFEDLRQVGAKAHWLSLGLIVVILFSIAGLPPLPGFFTKYFLMRDAWAAGLHVGVAFVLLSTLMGVGFYLKLMVPLFFSSAPESTARWRFTSSAAAGAASVVMMFVLLGGLNHLARWMTSVEAMAR